MTDLTTTQATTRAFTRKPNAAEPKRRGNGGLTRKITAAIEAQAFEGLTRAQAAQRAGITEHALYLALRKPSVLAYWNECLQVLRTGERARNIHRLVEIRDAANNMPAVNAIKVLEETADTRRDVAGQRVVSPGVVVVVNTQRTAPAEVDAHVIEINPDAG